MPNDSLVQLHSVSLTLYVMRHLRILHMILVWVIVTRSKAGSTDMSPLPVTVNQKTARQKSRKLNCQSSVQFVELPSGIEDSELSESCDDEVEVKTNCSVTKHPRRVIVPETEASSSTSLKQSCSWTEWRPSV